LQSDLRRFAIGPARILVLLPALEYFLSFQRARLIVARKTRLVTVATAIEAVSLATALFLCVGTFDLVGAIAAAIAIMLGRLAANTFLLIPAGTSARA
jgi:O-antigen/teichoic acid export membrane protein